MTYDGRLRPRASVRPPDSVPIAAAMPVTARSRYPGSPVRTATSAEASVFTSWSEFCSDTRAEPPAPAAATSASQAGPPAGRAGQLLDRAPQPRDRSGGRSGGTHAGIAGDREVGGQRRLRRPGDRSLRRGRRRRGRRNRFDRASRRSAGLHDDHGTEVAVLAAVEA